MTGLEALFLAAPAAAGGTGLAAAGTALGAATAAGVGGATAGGLGLGTLLGLGGNLLSGAGSIAGGMNAAQMAKAQARILERQAEEEKAAARREAMRKREEGERIGSRQLALAAASGGGVNDPTVLNIMGDTAAETEIHAEEIEYGGSVRAADLLNQASAVRAGGQQMKTAGIIKGIGSIASGGASLYDKLNPPRTRSRYAYG